MNMAASAKALQGRLSGDAVGRFRAVSLAGTAGIGVASIVYKFLRSPDSDGKDSKKKKKKEKKK